MALEVNSCNEGRAFGGGWLHLGATLLGWTRSMLKGFTISPN
jgi:hypothetical protein